MRLLIVSHTPHYKQNDCVVGWGPTIRELDYLAELFDEVVHVAPLYAEPAPASTQPYASTRIRLRPVKPSGGISLVDKLDILRLYPGYAGTIKQEMDSADAIHVRCPANITLLALWLLRRRSSPQYRWIKYAGNWQPEGQEPWSYRLQRRWLAEDLPNTVVTVNGNWSNQSPHVRSFLNPCLTEHEITEGLAVAGKKDFTLPVEVLFVGALNEGKGVGQVLRVFQALQAQAIPARLHLLGDGLDRPAYEAWSRENGLKEVHFMGWVPRSEVADYYARAQVILLPSRSEGWPKVLSEAMAYGVVPIAAAVSSIPQILATTGAGFSFQPDDVQGMAGAIAGMVAEPDIWRSASRAGVKAAPQFSYKTYQDAVISIFADAWGVQIGLPASDYERSVASPPCSPAESAKLVMGHGHD